MSEYSILLEICDYHANKICRKVIPILKSLKDADMLSFAEYGLKNVWDEICIQIQTNKSVMWDAYEETVEQTIKFIFKQTDVEILKLLSIMDEDENELADEDDFSYVNYKYNEDAACNIVKQKIFNDAGLYTNKRIEKYIEYNF